MFFILFCPPTQADIIHPLPQHTYGQHLYCKNGLTVIGKCPATSSMYRGAFCDLLTLTAKTQYQEFEPNIPRKGTARPQSQFLYIHVSVSDLYSPTIGLPILLQGNRWTGRSWKYIDH
jgi:hypothetical protein